MALSREAYKALESIVGSKYISEDPVICQAYTDRGDSREIVAYIGRSKRPACVVQPASTDEVQRIVKLCYRYKIPYTPASTLWVIHATPRTENSLLVDLKRMDQLEIDDRNMYAIVQPGVIFAQLQEEAMKRGLYTYVAGGGAQVSVLANHIFCSFSPLCYRVGMPHRRILAMEWILPDGEMLRTGSLALQDDDYFWGDGLGANLLGMVRGHIPWQGGAGIVTRMAVKLFPFQPERLEKVGLGPSSALQLPTNRMRWYNSTLPSHDALVKAMFEISKAQIGAAVTKVPIFWRYLAKAKDRNEFWDMWGKVTDEEIINTHILRVLLIGYTSEKQLEYEERVLMDIISELGGEPRRTRQTDQSWIKNADAAGMWFMTGSNRSCDVVMESINMLVAMGSNLAEAKERYTPPFMPTHGDKGWFQALEFGHLGYGEYLVYMDPRYTDPSSPDYRENDLRKVLQWYFIEVNEIDKRLGAMNLFQGTTSPLSLCGPYWGPNYHHWMEKWKNAFDPDNLSNPPAPDENSEFIKSDWWTRGKRED